MRGREKPRYEWRRYLFLQRDEIEPAAHAFSRTTPQPILSTPSRSFSKRLFSSFQRHAHASLRGTGPFINKGDNEERDTRRNERPLLGHFVLPTFRNYFYFRSFSVTYFRLSFDWCRLQQRISKNLNTPVSSIKELNLTIWRYERTIIHDLYPKYRGNLFYKLRTLEKSTVIYFPKSFLFVVCFCKERKVKRLHGSQ